MCSFEPPVTFVTMLLGVPGFAPPLALSEFPPQGAIFCGSPNWFSTIADSGASNLKCALANCGAIATAAKANEIPTNRFILESSLQGDITQNWLTLCLAGV